MAKVRYVEQENGKADYFQIALEIKRRKREASLERKTMEGQAEMAERKNKKARKNKKRLQEAYDRQCGYSLGRQ